VRNKRTLLPAMERPVQSRLRTPTRDPECYEIHKEGFESLIERRELDSASSAYSFNELTVATCRLLEEYGIDSTFSFRFEPALLALGVTEEWLATDSVTGKRHLLDVLKLIATSSGRSGSMRTMSETVRRLSIQGNTRGTEFDPESPNDNTNDAYFREIEHYLDEHTDHAASARAELLLADWSENALFAHVRSKLRIHTHEEQRPVRFVVLDHTSEEFAAEYGSSALHIFGCGTNSIVIGSNYEELPDLLEHEYAHSQSMGIVSFYRYLLFRGANEGLTELCTSNPMYYPRQRAALETLFCRYPVSEDLLFEAYKGTKCAKSDFLLSIANRFGLRSMLAFARMEAIEKPEKTGRVGESVCISTEEFIESLDRKR